MPLSYPPIRKVDDHGVTKYQATCRTCGQDVCARPQTVRAAVQETRRAHGFEAECTRGLCEWFAACTRPSIGTSPHRVLGAVPICSVCAERFNLEVNP